ncbi:MAG: methyltransferase domain-containing protein [Planctomycetes bacterium]|nr:methyltransferase domain-containing protein [Planctomycetota bacterium]
MDRTGNPQPRRRRWAALGLRVARLSLRPAHVTDHLVSDSYDHIASGYDDVWTDHMRHLSVEMLDRLAPPPDAECIDLTCGTGFVTAELARRSGRRAVGVDRSAGMLAVAHEKHGASCDFVQADVLAFLRSRPASSADVVTCGWGLGYSRPWAVIGQAARILRPGGRIGIIDNSLFSLAGVLWCSLVTFAERPEALQHVMKVRFLPSSLQLATIMRLRGFAVDRRWDGDKTYHVADGRAAIARLTATGAAAGFESAVVPEAREDVFARFAEVIEERRRTDDGIPITHRYLAAVGHRR